MASYFDEHDCEPLAHGEAPDHLLHLARLLLDSGVGAELQMEFDRMFPRDKSPPASKKLVDSLPRIKAASGLASTVFSQPNPNVDKRQCPVCIAYFVMEEDLIKLPCDHVFHPNCIIPWLNRTNSCPLCRFEMETDDADYEEFKKQKKRNEERDKNIEELHGGMFS